MSDSQGDGQDSLSSLYLSFDSQYSVSGRTSATNSLLQQYQRQRFGSDPRGPAEAIQAEAFAAGDDRPLLYGTDRVASTPWSVTAAARRSAIREALSETLPVPDVVSLIEQYTDAVRRYSHVT